MRLCFVGKYPPIEGGVARDNFWTAFALAERGHEVHVVTNAREVEDEFRIFDEPWDPALPPDPRELVRERLTVHYSTSAGAHGYIPWANPFVTKLAAIATDVVEAHGADLIYSYYFEPYAVAAYLAAQWTGVPFGVRHAGSDAGRLLLNPELRTAYTRVVRAADYVFASGGTWRRFMSLGVDLARLHRLLPSALPERYFHPEAVPLDVNARLRAVDARLPRRLYGGAFHRACERPFDAARPTIGIYGKVGESKGSYDLVRALGELKRAGFAFNLLTLTQGHARAVAAFLDAVAEAGIEAETWTLPFIPHWYVPSFIRACTSVCFLERDFPIRLHMPVVAREVLACGTALVLSHEIADKQLYRDRLRDGENVFLTEPRDTVQLAGVLRRCLADPARSREVGRAGYQELAADAPRFEEFGERLEEVFAGMGRDVAAARRGRRQGQRGRRGGWSCCRRRTAYCLGSTPTRCGATPRSTRGRGRVDRAWRWCWGSARFWSRCWRTTAACRPTPPTWRGTSG